LRKNYEKITSIIQRIHTAKMGKDEKRQKWAKMKKNKKAEIA
jgi:hypothetical protein